MGSSSASAPRSPLLLLLTIAAAEARPAHAVLLAFVFGLGRGVPFLVAGIAGSAITGLSRLGASSRAIQVVSGAALLVVGLYYVNIFVELL
jgi:cytochrome c-type biogenesis protein